MKASRPLSFNKSRVDTAYKSLLRRDGTPGLHLNCSKAFPAAKHAYEPLATHDVLLSIGLKLTFLASGREAQV